MRWLWVACTYYVVINTLYYLRTYHAAMTKGMKVPALLVIGAPIAYSAFFAFGMYNIFK